MNDHARGGPTARASYRAFHETFRVQIARRREEIARCQRLRYEVYCAERDWCDEIESDGEREFDRFDARAAHAMLIERSSERLIGTCRLILPAAGGDSPDLPIEELTGWPPYFSEEPLPRDRVGEISRFAVAKSALRQEAGIGPAQTAPKAEGAVASVIWQGERPALPNVSIGLMRGIVLMARAHGIEYLCASMDPALIKLFSRIDVTFTGCGDCHRYHGLRRPCHTRLAWIAESLKANRPNLYRIIFDEAGPQEDPAGGGERKLVS